jgi:hypothetical protein
MPCGCAPPPSAEEVWREYQRISLAEEEMAEARGIAIRTLRAERQRGDGPPWVKITKQVFYPVEGFRAWLKAIEQRPVRARKAA